MPSAYESILGGKAAAGGMMNKSKRFYEGGGLLGKSPGPGAYNNNLHQTISYSETTTQSRPQSTFGTARSL